MEIEEEKYIYQRISGDITKYLKGEKYLLNIETGINFPIDTLLLGKVSENILDLIEVGDYVNGIRILDITGDYIHTEEFDCCKERLQNKFKSIVTKEQFSSLEYII